MTTEIFWDAEMRFWMSFIALTLATFLLGLAYPYIRKAFIICRKYVCLYIAYIFYPAYYKEYKYKHQNNNK